MMYEDHQEQDETTSPRPLSMVLLGGLYLFFLLLTVSTYGSPFPFMGTIFEGKAAQLLVFTDSMVTLYLFLGLMKRQQLTWYLLIGYNLFEIANTTVNLLQITPSEVEKIAGRPVDQQALVTNNISVIIAIILLTLFIYRQRHHFTNTSRYLF